MPTESAEVAVAFTLEFKRNLRLLSKKYPHVRSDVQPIVEQLQAGDFVGERIRGTERVVFKVRVQNSDIQKGSRSGYRLIYCLKTPALAILVTIYSKLEQSDISAGQIRQILTEFDQRGD